MPARRVSKEVKAALIGAVVVVVGVLLGAYFNSQLVAKQFDDQSDQLGRERQADREDAVAAARKERLRLDLADLREVLDDTAEHLARATRSVDVLRDRCTTAVREGVAPEVGVIQSASATWQDWQRAVDNSYREVFELRVDRERLRVRVSELELFKRFDELELLLRESRNPCVQRRLVPEAAGAVDDRLKEVRRCTTRYYKEVEATAGTQIDVPTVPGTPRGARADERRSERPYGRCSDRTRELRDGS